MSFINRTDLGPLIGGGIGYVLASGGQFLHDAPDPTKEEINFKKYFILKPTHVFWTTVSSLFLTAIRQYPGNDFAANTAFLVSLALTTNLPLLAKRIGIIFFDKNEEKPIKFLSLQTVKVVAYAVTNFAAFFLLGRLIEPIIRPYAAITLYPMVYLGSWAISCAQIFPQDSNFSIGVCCAVGAVSSGIFAYISKTNGFIAGILPAVLTFTAFSDPSSFSKLPRFEKVRNIAAIVVGLSLVGCVGSYLDVLAKRNGIEIN